MEKSAPIEVQGRELRLSNLDRILFPANGFTKAQVIDFYIRISKYILPHLKNRPLTLKLYPKGVESPPHYHHDAPAHTPSWIQIADVRRKNGGSEIHFILVNDLPSLIWTANQNNIEMHTLLAKAPRTEQPTALLFDLDPGQPANILHCAQVTLWLKDILEGLKIKSLVKLSGDKGLHLYAPLNSPDSYDETQAFAKAVAESLEQQHPDVVVSTMNKRVRAGKVFVDWSQNAPHKSTACAYSLRASSAVPRVALPLGWAELAEALDRGDLSRVHFEPEAAIQRVEKLGDLFAPLLTLKQRLPADYSSRLENLDSKQAAKARSASTLAAYEARRDFSRTREPTAKVPPRKGPQQEHLFVIQKHAARNLHYDFRLEMEGVLRSWAVPKGPPLQRGERRLAMHVEDHPMEYARFEGTIPKGQYGGGTVMVWDIGTYSVPEGDPATGYQRGKISLELKGKKLKGGWVLVRAGRQENGKESWLLIKTGANSRPISQRRNDTSALTGRSMQQIATDKESAEWSSNRV